MTKMLIFSLCSTWTNRRQPWGRWTTVGWGSTSRFLHQNICVGTKLVIITMFRNWYCFYSIYAELWTYKFSFNHLIDIFMQYCCKKKDVIMILFPAAGDLHCGDGESKQQVWLLVTVLSFLCLSHFHFHITFILFSLSYHFHFHITFIRLIGHSGSLLLRFHVNINIKLFHFYFFSISLWLSFNHVHII